MNKEYKNVQNTYSFYHPETKPATNYPHCSNDTTLSNVELKALISSA